ncbi:MFS general substrate transporter, partial [Mycena olivaceomarginata]
EERKLWQKIDLSTDADLSLLYLSSFLGSRLQGLETQLDLTGNKYNIALPYCICETPANLLYQLNRSRWLPGITVVWGIIMTLMGLVKTICLGVAEAGLFPGLPWRIGLFFGAASLAGAFSGALAYGISFMSGTRGLLGGPGSLSWCEGIATVVVGFVAFFVLVVTDLRTWYIADLGTPVIVDFPAKADFLTPEQLAIRCSPFLQNTTTPLWEKKNIFEYRHLVWMHMSIYMSIITNLLLFSQLLTVPPYVSFCCISPSFCSNFAYWSDRTKMRFPFILAGRLSLLWSISGFICTASRLPGVKYFAYAAVPGIISWLGNNLSGQYKRGAGMPSRSVSVTLGQGAFASNMYRTQDKPRFPHGCEIMFVLIGLISTIATALISRRAARLALESGESKVYTDKALRAMGDRAPDFRYTL